MTYGPQHHTITVETPIYLFIFDPELNVNDTEKNCHGRVTLLVFRENVESGFDFIILFCAKQKELNKVRNFHLIYQNRYAFLFLEIELHWNCSNYIPACRSLLELF